MKAAFTYAVRYQVEAVCVSPLRTAGADADPETVLRDGDGRAFLQGSSIAGAFRNYLHQTGDGNEASLFGSRSCGGHLIVSDGLFRAEVQQSIRPRLRIDGFSGSAANGGKFDVAQINRDAQFSFELVWLGTKQDLSELTSVEQLLAALNAGAITLGAQKTNGFGRVSVAVRKRAFDLSTEKDRKAWLADDQTGTPLVLPAGGDVRHVSFTVYGATDSILVKAASVVYDKNGDSYTGNLTENDKAVLPGSSVKGAVRAHAESIAPLLGLAPEALDCWFGRGAIKGDDGLRGCILFQDTVLEGERRKISRIRINRFSGGVMRGGLFSEEPVCGDVKLELRVPADLPAACGLLTYVLRDLGLGLFHLGSGGAVGRGYIKVREVRVKTPDGKTATLKFGADGCTAEDSAGMLNGWMDAIGGMRHED